ncbi:aminoglycoside adenylyltransferase family protein [Luteipulveratus flavus]|uniref:Aminoglycoside adenylyltransferase family protein n=1 Tax=Luteipulveratus flavus TaxID=3031728 RepID=A0ABT6CA39_9MICO|nr:aminoglycoside adenylyltransferase family protein [Luteipulveratus sp. YIM 133296]MDF8265660.1 aminoglycoside adenylyltransferase family protein [Luteipulveratus sp. YIM 133296]
MEPAVSQVLAHCDEHDPGGVLGVHLYGSAVAGGLRPDSDVDLLLLTERALTASERSALTQVLLDHSGRRARRTPGRPVELTCIVRSSVAPWAYPPMSDYQYGEWLRDEALAGDPLGPKPSPDLAVLLTQARADSVALRGAALSDVTADVPPADLRRAVLDSLDPLLADLDGDERNVLLTLARMVVTLESGRIVAKDVAAAEIGATLTEADRGTLDLARRAYLGEAHDDWTHRRTDARVTAAALAARIRAQTKG